MLSLFSCVQFCVTPWTIAHQPPLSMGFSRQEYWSGLPFPYPEDLPDPRIEPMSLGSPALACRFFTTSTIWEAPSSPRLPSYLPTEGVLGKYLACGWVNSQNLLALCPGTLSNLGVFLAPKQNSCFFATRKPCSLSESASRIKK